MNSLITYLKQGFLHLLQIISLYHCNISGIKSSDKEQEIIYRYPYECYRCDYRSNDKEILKLHIKEYLDIIIHKYLYAYLQINVIFCIHMMVDGYVNTYIYYY